MMQSCVEEGNYRLWKQSRKQDIVLRGQDGQAGRVYFVRDQNIDKLESELRACQESMERYEEHLDDIERHSRAVN